MAKRIKSTDLMAIYPDAGIFAYLFTLAQRPFTTFYIKKIGDELNGYDYVVVGYLRTWVYILTYPLQMLVILAMCLWDGGLKEFHLPTYRHHFYYDRFDWVDADNDVGNAKFFFENAKKLWERA